MSSDIWGLSKTIAKGGYNYFSTWTDNSTRFTVIYLQKSKSEAFSKFKAFEAWLMTQHSWKVGKLHSDRGGEYTGKEIDQYLAEKGIERSLTTHDTPQQNGVAERLNYTLVNMVRATLLGSC
jgi:transposase InsO family protein